MEIFILHVFIYFSYFNSKLYFKLYLEFYNYFLYVIILCYKYHFPLSVFRCIYRSGNLLGNK